MGSQGHCTHTSYLHTVCIHTHTHTLQHTTSNHRLSFSCPFPHTTAYCSLLHTQIMMSPKGTPNPPPPPPHTHASQTPPTHLLLKLLPHTCFSNSPHTPASQTPPTHLLLKLLPHTCFSNSSHTPASQTPPTHLLLKLLPHTCFSNSSHTPASQTPPTHLLLKLLPHTCFSNSSHTPASQTPPTHLLLKLLPAVGPSPVVSLVQAIPHSHHLIATVIEDGSESSREQTESCTATEHTDTYDPHSQTGNLVSQDTSKGHTLHGAMTDTSQHTISTVGTFRYSCENVDKWDITVAWLL